MAVRRRKKKNPIFVDNYSRYDVVHEALEVMGFTLKDIPEGFSHSVLPDITTSHLLWSDLSVSVERIKKFENWQKCNHFPSMHLLSQKIYLCASMKKAQKVVPGLFDFFPKTWSLRSERTALRNHCQSVRFKTYIMKPNGGSQGKGIIITKDPINAETPDGVDYIVQEYMSKPLLIEGKKFDMRVYVLITNIRVPSVFVYSEGLVRICAETYSKPKAKNLENTCMHLTNYAINKHSEKFERGADEENADDGTSGNKRDFRFLTEFLRENGNDPDVLWSRLDDVVAKTVLSVHPELEHVYNACFPLQNDGFSCFEVLGLDILVDTKLRPWLLEVNHSPNLVCDAAIDHRIKLSMLQDALKVVNLRPDARAADVARLREITQAEVACKNDIAQRWLTDKLSQEDTLLGGFRRVLPATDPEKKVVYDMIERELSLAHGGGSFVRRRSSASGIRCSPAK